MHFTELRLVYKKKLLAYQYFSRTGDVRVRGINSNSKKEIY